MIIDLVVNHTSDQHPWFQSARSSPDSPYRDWYVWSNDEPSDLHQGMVFPGEQKTTWTWDDAAGAWYYHRFYDFQPDLNMANPAVRAEIEKIISFWLKLGVVRVPHGRRAVRHRAHDAQRARTRRRTSRG